MVRPVYSSRGYPNILLKAGLASTKWLSAIFVRQMALGFVAKALANRSSDSCNATSVVLRSVMSRIDPRTINSPATTSVDVSAPIQPEEENHSKSQAISEGRNYALPVPDFISRILMTGKFYDLLDDFQEGAFLALGGNRIENGTQRLRGAALFTDDFVFESEDRLTEFWSHLQSTSGCRFHVSFEIAVEWSY